MVAGSRCGADADGDPASAPPDRRPQPASEPLPRKPCSQREAIKSWMQAGWSRWTVAHTFGRRIAATRANAASSALKNSEVSALTVADDAALSVIAPSCRVLVTLPRHASRRARVCLDAGDSDRTMALHSTWQDQFLGPDTRACKDVRVTPAKSTTWTTCKTWRIGCCDWPPNHGALSRRPGDRM